MSTFFLRNLRSKFTLSNHHRNIDRMMSIWGGLHPKEAREWLENAPDAVVNLIPFRTNQYGDYHTPRACWDTESLGYAYPETKRWEKKYQTNGEFDEDKLQVELTEYLNKKYNSAASAQKKAALTTTREEPADKTITDPKAAAVDEAPKLGALIGGQEVKGAVISAIPEGKKAEDLLPDILEGYDYVADVIYEK